MSSTIKSRALSNGSGHEPPDSRGIVILLSAIVVVSVLIFGAVDSATLTLLAVMFFAIVVLWFWSAFADGMCWLNTNALQFPLLVLFLIGIIQLLPLGSTHIPPGLLSMPAVSTLSLEPYATRFFLARLFLYVLFFAAGLTYINTFAKMRTT